jgi:hypothetical protein
MGVMGLLDIFPKSGNAGEVSLVAIWNSRRRKNKKVC